MVEDKVKKPSDCKFWDKGMCTHKDAPPDDKRCIGMGDDIVGGCTAWMDDAPKSIGGTRQRTYHRRNPKMTRRLFHL